MLNFLVSTIAFSLAAYALNRMFKTHLASSSSLSIAVVVAATLFSITIGWIVDELDGDAELHKNDPSLMEVVQSGDLVKVAKLLVGFN